MISAFNDLCPLISKLPLDELKCIVVELMAVFGTHLTTLIRVLPSVTMLSPELHAISQVGHNVDISMSRVAFMLQLFMRVVSSKTHPIFLFLDDLNWADESSLDVLHHILSDIKCSSCVYFVGSYRVNEVPTGHALFKFTRDLQACNVRMNKIHLDGLNIEDVNQLIGDALGTFPRICKPLSQLVLRKTKG